MPAPRQKENASTLDTLCEDYLPRVFRYVCYWVSDKMIAEELTLKVLKGSITVIDGKGGQTDSVAREIFNSVRKTVQSRISENLTSLRDLSQQEREVISLKLGAELPNSSIAGILGLPETEVGELLVRSLNKLRGS